MKIKILCENCKKEFEVIPCREFVRKNGGWVRRKFCSVKCSTESLRPFWNSDEEKVRRSVRQEGSNNSNYKGGEVERQGYVYVMHQEPHLHKQWGCYVPRATLIMEQHLSRKLTIDEITHHVNGIRNDDRIENLLLTNASKHAQIHAELRGPEHMEKMRAARKQNQQTAGIWTYVC